MKRQLLPLLLLGALLAPLPGLARPEPHAADRAVVDTIALVAPAFAFVGSASGVVIDPSGLVVTNYHVVADDITRAVASEWLVRIGTRSYRATVLGYDPVGDLALLQVASEDPLPAVTLAAQTPVRIGDPVVALGNPFNTSQRVGDPTATSGMVSAIDRFIDQQPGTVFADLLYPDALQTDAAINPGNSGGPLFDLQGRLVGINGQIRTRYGTRSNTGIGLAIPADQIAEFLPLMRRAAGGPVFHGILRGLAEPHDDRGPRSGARIARVRSGSAAEAVGLVAGDLIVAVDGEPVRTWNRCRGLIMRRPAGASCRLTIRRDGERLVLPVSLESYRVPLLGVHFAPVRRPVDLTDLTIRRLVPDTPAAESGLRVGDRLLAIARRPVRQHGDIQTILHDLELLAGDEVEVSVYRDHRRRSIRLRLADKFPPSSDSEDQDETDDAP